jgi:hypothetical protein
MGDTKVHYEVFIRRKLGMGWTLDFATEDRAHAVESAEQLMAEGRVAAVRVTKEILNEATGQYSSLSILTRGDIQLAKKKSHMDEEVDDGILCVTPQDLYTVHARERIGRLLESWLKRYRATPFELLHRPDLIEKLDASGLEIQHALQKIAIPEAQSRPGSVHEVIRRYQKLVDDAIARILGDQRRRLFPVIATTGFIAAVHVAMVSSEPSYVLGVAVAGAMAPAASLIEKIALLLDMAEQAPPEGPARAFAFRILEQPLSELLGSKTGVAALVGESAPDMGSGLAMMTRLVAPEMVDALIKADPVLGRQFPAIDGGIDRLALWLADPLFDTVRAALARRILAELNGPRRLRPDDPAGEIQSMRAMARVLIMAGPRVVQPDEVQNAFIQRSKSLVTPDFVQIYLEQAEGGALGECQALVRLGENVVGVANKRAAAKWLKQVVFSLRFERDLVTGQESAAWKLAHLADLERMLGRVGLVDEDRAEIAAKIGEVGGLVEAEAKLAQAVASANAPPAHRMMLLLKMASGESAPHGPAAARGKAEALRLARDPAVRVELASIPELGARMQDLLGVGVVAAA